MQKNIMKNNLYDIKKMKIYVVDNDYFNTLLIKELLLEEKFNNVEIFTSAKELLEKMKNSLPDLILSDIMMPEMNGYELCRIIKEIPKWEHIPIIMVTAASNEDSEPLRLSFEHGAMDFLNKPINRIELIARVKSALKLEKQRKELKRALDEVQVLQGLLPICSYCKKVRNDSDYWEEIESYISANSDANFSHSICPTCYREHVLPELEEIKKEIKKS